MSKSTKQTLLSSWIRRKVEDGGQGDDKIKAAAPASIEKRKREYEEKGEEKKREVSTIDDAADDDGLDLDLNDAAGKENAATAPSSSSSSSSGSDPELEDEHDVDDQGRTAYERERELLIARNREALAALGVASAARALCGANAPPPPPKRRSSVKSKSRAGPSSSAAFPEEFAARRSSLRPRRGGLAVASAAAAAEGGAASLPSSSAAAVPRPRTPAPEPETYDNKIVFSYIICDGAKSGGGGGGGGGGGVRATEVRGSPSTPSALPSSLRRLPLVLSGPVVRAYSVSASRCGSLLAAGGKDGWACIWGLRGLRSGEEEDEAKDGDGAEEEEGEGLDERAPLLSARLHRSWIADVALVSSGSNSDSSRAPLLLTAANDGMLAVHDSGAAAEQTGRSVADDSSASAAPAGAPRRLASATPHGGSGIFSMAVDDFSSSSPSSSPSDSYFDVATASKDGSVAVSRVESGGGRVKTITTIEDAHGGAVAKCVRWRDSSTLASCGNDGAVRLWDARCPYGGGGGGAAALEIEGATLGGVAANVVRWRPRESSSSLPNHLLVAGTNPEALMFDVRSPKGPLFVLKPPPPSGGSSLGKGSSSVIFQPCFVARGRAVAVGLPRSRVVSLFDADGGAPLSRGDVGGHDASTLACFEARDGGGGEEVVAAVGTRSLHLFSAVSQRLFCSV